MNIFYLLTGFLNLFKSISVNSPLVVFIPLSFIIMLGVVKELIGECKRYKEDKIVNATPVKRLSLKGSKAYGENGANEPQFEDTTLAEVVVGDIIRVKDGEALPTDCVLIQVEDDKPECFVKTAALDGERNLKPKLSN